MTHFKYLKTVNHPRPSKFSLLHPKHIRYFLGPHVVHLSWANSLYRALSWNPGLGMEPHPLGEVTPDSGCLFMAQTVTDLWDVPCEMEKHVCSAVVG